MRRNRGFILLSELLCFALSALLLASTLQSLTACFEVQRKILLLSEALDSAMQAASGLEVKQYLIQQRLDEQNGYLFKEVAVYASENSKLICTLLEAQPTE